MDRGCMLFLDVLHGAAGRKKPPNPKDARQYISLMVAVDRLTREPDFLSFHIPPDADRSQGFRIGFAKDQQVQGTWHTKVEENQYELAFDSCDKDSCVARMREGKVDDGQGGFIDLLQSFHNEDHVWLMYMKNGQAITTMIPLGPFRSAYEHLLTTDMPPQK